MNGLRKTGEREEGIEGRARWSLRHAAIDFLRELASAVVISFLIVFFVGGICVLTGII